MGTDRTAGIYRNCIVINGVVHVPVQGNRCCDCSLDKVCGDSNVENWHERKCQNPCLLFMNSPARSIMFKKLKK